MAYNEELATRVRGLIEGRQGFSEKKMFGGIAYLIGGNMACGIVRDELMVRVGPDVYEEALSRPHARLMDFTGRPMRGMVMVGSEGVASDDSLREWVKLGTDYAGSLPAKK